MTRYLTLFLIIMSITSGANAEDDLVLENHKKLFQNQRLQQVCSHRAVNHIPNNDVAYKPGIDAKGNFIVPPDIGFTMSGPEYPIRVPLELDIIERFDLDVPIGIISDPEIAGIMVYEDGKVTYNGHDVSGKVESFCIDNKIIPAPKPEKKPEIKPDIEVLPLEGEVIEGEHH